MKKAHIAIAFLLLLCLPAMAQKKILVGSYHTADNEDTSIRVFLSYDSVKMIATVRQKHNQWLQVYSGSWTVKQQDAYAGYPVIFRLNDGTTKEAVFAASYADKHRKELNGYTLYIGHTRLGKEYGPGGLLERIIDQLRTPGN